jgi:nanoRNase/pAp phosphatase (c-di-AMP/oligoRNAs hydrolase)
VLCSIGETDNPEMCAEIADLLLRLEGKHWVIVGGLYKDNYHVSVRTDGNGREAWLLLRDAMKSEGSFGGHGSVAGGRIHMADTSARALGRLERRLQSQILESLGASHLTATTLG